jgi:hypothetical protein
MLIRPDFIFYYWIFVWFLLYWFKITKYNPKFLLILGILENLLTIGLTVYYKTNVFYIVYFIIVLFFMKVLPLYLVWNNKNNIRDLKRSVLIYIFYNFWLKYNKTDFLTIHKSILRSIIGEKNETPILCLISKFSSKYLTKYITK